MTQKAKLLEALKYAQRMKNLADRIDYDAKSFDCTWPKNYVRDITDQSNYIINILLGKVK